MIDKELAERIDDYQKSLEDIITEKVSLRDPCISVVRFPLEYITEISAKHSAILKQLKQKYPNWNYETLNIERMFYDVLEARRYLGQRDLIEFVDRETFQEDLRNSIVKEMVKRIEDQIKQLKEKNINSNNPPFLVLLNINAGYPYIQTKDFVGQIINEKGVYVIILYPQKKTFNTEDDEPYKSGNYLVHTYSFFPTKSIV